MKRMVIMYQNRTLKAVSVLIVLANFALFLGLAVECSSSKSNTVTGPAPNKVVIQNDLFNPDSIAVSTGTTVTWTNMDSLIHTISSGTPANPTTVFESGNVSPNGTYSFTFNTKGTYPYYCKVHPFMTGKVVVQ